MSTLFYIMFVCMCFLVGGQHATALAAYETKKFPVVWLKLSLYGLTLWQIGSMYMCMCAQTVQVTAVKGHCARCAGDAH